MKFASFLKFAVLALLAGVFVLALAGCGATSNLNLTPGNWSMAGTPNGGGAGSVFYIGGNLTQSGAKLTGTMEFISSTCYSFSQIVAFTGTVKGNNVKLTSANVGGEVLTITASGTSGSALTGTYSIAGGIGCNGQTGTIAANPVASVSATWSGPLVGDSNGDPNVMFAVALTEATTAATDGTFGLSGTLTYTGSTCSTSGTIDGTTSFIVGPYLLVNATTDDGGTLTYTADLNNTASPTATTNSSYSVSGGNCNDLLTLNLTKQ